MRSEGERENERVILRVWINILPHKIKPLISLKPRLTRTIFQPTNFRSLSHIVLIIDANGHSNVVRQCPSSYQFRSSFSGQQFLLCYLGTDTTILSPRFHFFYWLEWLGKCFSRCCICSFKRILLLRLCFCIYPSSHPPFLQGSSFDPILEMDGW